VANNNLTKQKMKRIEDLKARDYIAFAWSYINGEPKQIWVSNITLVSDDGFIVHFMYGHKSIGELVKFDDVLAIGNKDGASEIKGWSGKFDIIQPEHPLIINGLKTQES
jgi:hypothetical protein